MIMFWLGKLKGYLVAGAVFMGVLLMAYFKGAANAKAEAREAVLKQKIKINEALKETDKRNEVEHNEANEKAESGDFSGFNRKPDSMHDDST